MAEKLKDLFREHGYRLFIDSPTNQQFIILSNIKIEALSEQVRFEIWEPYDNDHKVVRFATSWATTEEDIAFLAELL